jgi:undecaprenyl-diphosphatase
MALLETQTRTSRVTNSGLRRWRLVFVALAALVIASAFWFDAAVQSWMVSHQSPGMRAFMRNVSWWGDWPWHVAFGLIGVAVAYACGSRRWLAIFVAMIIACAVAGTVNRAIKIAAGRSRPSVEIDAGWNGPRFSSKYNAFPSGHTAASSAFFAALCFASWRFGVWFLPIPLLIGFSRLYVGAHHLSDVVCAAILGAVCAAVLTPYVQRRLAGHSTAENRTRS